MNGAFTPFKSPLKSTDNGNLRKVNDIFVIRGAFCSTKVTAHQRRYDCTLVFCLAAMLWICRSNKQSISHTGTVPPEYRSQFTDRK